MSWMDDRIIVLPIDFSDESQGAIDVARSLAKEVRQIKPIYVAPVLSAAEPGVIWEVIADEARSKNIREEFAKQYGASLPGVDIEVVFGDPSSEVADFAKRINAGIIILPSHGRTGFSRLLIGSVAERIVRLAHCPVLVLRK